MCTSVVGSATRSRAATLRGTPCERRTMTAALGAVGAIAAMLIAMPVEAQQFVGLGGLGARIGAVSPQNAETGFDWSVDADLGYFKSPRIRTIAGVNGFSADVDRRVGTTPVGGSLSAFGGYAGFRLEPLGMGRFTPYLTTTASAHNVTADVSDEGTKELLEGFYAGAGLGAGLTFVLDDASRFAATAETRRVWMNNVGHWAFEIGMRYMPRGRNAYARVDDDRDEMRREAEVRRAELARIEMERRLADSLVAARREAEQQRADAAAEEEARRVREQREAAQRQEAERLEAERKAQQQRTEDEMAKLRARSDSLEAARRLEAERRMQAEADAEAARRRAQTAEAARLEAERTAAESERKRYAALLELDRLMTNVTDIRETERGLSVVLGQGLFASGQYELSSRARDEVGTISAVLAQYPDQPIAVEGHTDAVGSEMANQRLSERRAEAVRAALIATGVNPTRVTSVGFGEGRPMADNDTADGRAANRRVEIVIVGARRPTPGGGA